MLASSVTELRQPKYFVAVAEEASFTLASAKVNVALDSTRTRHQELVGRG